jgi:hypothetical protein
VACVRRIVMLSPRKLAYGNSARHYHNARTKRDLVDFLFHPRVQFVRMPLQHRLRAAQDDALPRVLPMSSLLPAEAGAHKQKPIVRAQLTARP